jgi:hypothetical protein
LLRFCQRVFIYLCKLQILLAWMKPGPNPICYSIALGRALCLLGGWPDGEGINRCLMDVRKSACHSCPSAGV